MGKSDIIEKLIGPGGALVLACVALYVIFSHYQNLINMQLAEAKEDRALYRESVSAIVERLDRIETHLHGLHAHDTKN